MTEQQKNLFTGRWRKVKKPEPSELQVQIALIELLGYMVLDNAVYFAVPNGELRDPRTAAKLKAMGVLPGVADIIFLYRPYDDQLTASPIRVLCLELKAPGRQPSDVQRYFSQRVSQLGAHFEVADSVPLAVELLKKHKVLRPNQALT